VPAAKPAPAAKPQINEDDDIPFDPDPPKSAAKPAGNEASSRAADIIAMIRNRQKSE
jgi:hypothetical protein